MAAAWSSLWEEAVFAGPRLRVAGSPFSRVAQTRVLVLPRWEPEQTEEAVEFAFVVGARSGAGVCS